MLAPFKAIGRRKERISRLLLVCIYRHIANEQGYTSFRLKPRAVLTHKPLFRLVSLA